MDFTSTGIAAGRSRMCSQSTELRKNGINLRSSRPFWDPSLEQKLKMINKGNMASGKTHLRSGSQQNLTIVSFASSEMGVSGGKINVSRQFMTLRYVS